MIKYLDISSSLYGSHNTLMALNRILVPRPRSVFATVRFSVRNMTVLASMTHQFSIKKAEWTISNVEHS